MAGLLRSTFADALLIAYQFGSLRPVQHDAQLPAFLAEIIFAADREFILTDVALDWRMNGKRLIKARSASTTLGFGHTVPLVHVPLVRRVRINLLC